MSTCTQARVDELGIYVNHSCLCLYCCTSGIYAYGMRINFVLTIINFDHPMIPMPIIDDVTCMHRERPIALGMYIHNFGQADTWQRSQTAGDFAAASHQR